MPLFYHPKNSRKQKNIEILIPGTSCLEELVLDDVASVERAIETDEWCLGYAVMVQSS